MIYSKIFCIFFLIYIFIIFAFIINSIMALKTDGVFIRMTPQLKELFQDLAKRKAMSQTNLIEYLIRKEDDNTPKDDSKKV